MSKKLNLKKFFKEVRAGERIKLHSFFESLRSGIDKINCTDYRQIF